MQILYHLPKRDIKILNYSLLPKSILFSVLPVLHNTPWWRRGLSPCAVHGHGQPLAEVAGNKMWASPALCCSLSTHRFGSCCSLQGVYLVPRSNWAIPLAVPSASLFCAIKSFLFRSLKGDVQAGSVQCSCLALQSLQGEVILLPSSFTTYAGAVGHRLGMPLGQCPGFFLRTAFHPLPIRYLHFSDQNVGLVGLCWSALITSSQDHFLAWWFAGRKRKEIHITSSDFGLHVICR